MKKTIEKILFNKKESKGTFFEHIIFKLNQNIKKKGKSLLITTTKRSAEEISNLLLEKGYKAYFLHSEIDTLERFEIIKKLRSGVIDVLVGVNLLREGIDLPEVTFIGILDADNEGFLRSTTALIQIIGRAARNPKSEVVLYADHITKSMYESIMETHRRRNIQKEHNEKFGLKPQIALSNIKNIESAKDQGFDINYQNKEKKKKLKRMTKKEKEIIIANLDKQLKEAIKNWDFEKASTLRDQIKEISE